MIEEQAVNKFLSAGQNTKSCVTTSTNILRSKEVELMSGEEKMHDTQMDKILQWNVRTWGNPHTKRLLTKEENDDLNESLNRSEIKIIMGNLKIKGSLETKIVAAEMLK